MRVLLSGLGVEYPMYLTHWQVGPLDLDLTAAFSVILLTRTADLDQNAKLF